MQQAAEVCSASCIYGTFITRDTFFESVTSTAALFVAPADRLWATAIKEMLVLCTHGITVSAQHTRLRYSSFARKS